MRRLKVEKLEIKVWLPREMTSLVWPDALDDWEVDITIEPLRVAEQFVVMGRMDCAELAIEVRDNV